MVVQLGRLALQTLVSFKVLLAGQPVQTAGVPSVQVAQLLAVVQAPQEPSAALTK